MAICSFRKSAVLSHFRNRRFCLIFEIGGTVSFKIGCFVLPPSAVILRSADAPLSKQNFSESSRSADICNERMLWDSRSMNHFISNSSGDITPLSVFHTICRVDRWSYGADCWHCQKRLVIAKPRFIRKVVYWMQVSSGTSNVETNF